MVLRGLQNMKFKKIVKEADNEPKFSLDINGKEELDELYSLVAAGINSKTSDAKFLVAKKWRDRLGQFYGDLNQKGGIVNEVETDKSNPNFKSLDQATWEIGRTPDGKRQNESEDGGGSDHPRIYVGTYAKYNDGSIDGKWIDLTDYSNYEDFVDACRELHKDEKDPEFMVQDYENFPEKWYHEGGLPTEEEFNKITDYYLMDDTEKAAYEAYVNYTDDDDIDDFHEAYQGQFDSASDFAYNIIDDLGWDGIGSDNLDMYFDYDSFGRDLMFDFHMGEEDNEDSEGNPEDPDHYYDNDGYDMGEYESDDQVARDYIDSIGGVDQLGADTARNYFDYEAFGRDLLMTDYFEEDGFVFRHL